MIYAMTMEEGRLGHETMLGGGQTAIAEQSKKTIIRMIETALDRANSCIEPGQRKYKEWSQLPARIEVRRTGKDGYTIAGRHWRGLRRKAPVQDWHEEADMLLELAMKYNAELTIDWAAGYDVIVEIKANMPNGKISHVVVWVPTGYRPDSEIPVMTVGTGARRKENPDKFGPFGEDLFA